MLRCSLPGEPSRLHSLAAPAGKVGALACIFQVCSFFLMVEVIISSTDLLVLKKGLYVS